VKKTGKINKYGFIHIDKDIYNALGLPRKQDIPLEITVNAETKTITCKILEKAPETKTKPKTK